MNLSGDANLDIENWACFSCSGQNVCQPIVHDEDDQDEDERSDHVNFLIDTNVSSHAPDPSKVWPPFALFGSSEAAVILGPECSNIPDDTGSLFLEQEASPGQQTVANSETVANNLEMQGRSVGLLGDGEFVQDNKQSSVSMEREEEATSSISLVATQEDSIPTTNIVGKDGMENNQMTEALGEVMQVECALNRNGTNTTASGDVQFDAQPPEREGMEVTASTNEDVSTNPEAPDGM